MHHYRVDQTDFNINTARDNGFKLLLHTTDVLLRLYRRYPGFNDFFPLQVEMRCYKLINFLIIYDIISMFEPEQVCIDPFQYLLMRGGG